MFRYFVLILSLISIIKSESNSTQNWNQLIQSFNKYQTKRIENDINFVENIYNSSKISWICRKSLSQTLNSLKSLELFAYQMYDSWPAFPPEGILEGTVSSFGDYDQCLSIESNQIIGSSQYCLITLKIPLPLNSNSKHINVNHKVDNLLPDYLVRNKSNGFHHFFNKLSENAIFFHLLPIKVGLCLPNKCHSNDIEIMAEKAFENSGLILVKTDCNTRTETHLNRMQTIALSIVMTFLLFTIFGTFFHKNYVKNPKYQQFLESFSVKRNLIKLMSTEVKPELSCLDGLRVLTMFYIIVAHVIEYTDWSLYKDTFKIRTSMNEWQNIPLTKVHTLVETFFLFSGLLASYTTLKQTKGNLEKFNPISYVCQRIIRLLPLMAIFIFLSFLVPLINSGPFWNQFWEERVGVCYENWWKNLLFIHNFIDGHKMCIGSTWFISVDLQFHVFSLLVIVLILKKPKIGLIFNSLVILLFCVLTAFLIIANDFSAGRVSTQFGEHFMKNFLTQLYWRPWPHAPVFFIGIAFGFLLYKRRENLNQLNQESNQNLLSKNKKRLIWISITIGFCLCFYDTYYWTFGAKNNKYISAVLLPTTRIIWSLNVSTIVWMCVSGNGVLVNRVLSWSAFTPLSRLNYTVYLTHIWIVWCYWASRRQLPDLMPSNVFVVVSYSVFFSYIFAFVFSLLFESPLTFFQNYLRSKFFSKPIITQNVTNNNQKPIEISLNPNKC